MNPKVVVESTGKVARSSWKRVDSERDRIGINVKDDRLSSLPDDLIHKILSFMTIKEAIETSALSSRWRFIWTSLPYLNFSSEDFDTLRKFSKFVTQFLSARNNDTQVSSLTLRFCGKVSQVFVREVLNYAFSHNIQQLNVKCLFKERIAFPLSLFRSHSLKHLSLSAHIFHHPITLTSSWELPKLATLHLSRVKFDNEESINGLLSKCVNLKNLTIEWCIWMGSNGLRICHPGLTNLTIKGHLAQIDDMVVPQLKNLSIRDSSGKHLISAPLLASLLVKRYNPLQISTDSFPVLEKADVCISNPKEADANEIVCMLQQLRSVKFLTLNLETVEVLSSSVERIFHQPSPFANLKSLYIYPEIINRKKVDMSTKVKKYLLNGSPSATFTMVSREDIIAARDATSALNLMVELRVLLEREKATIEDHMGQGNAQLKRKKQRHFEGKMVEMESYWKDLRMQWQKWETETDAINSRLREIEELLTKLPTSHRDKMQPKFYNLRAEAVTIMNDMMKCMKIQHDNKLHHRSRLSSK